MKLLSASTSTRRRLLKGGAAAATSAFGCFPNIGLSQTARDAARLICDFRIYGGTAPFFYGIDKGLFKDLGIDMSADGSTGSADAVVKVASGAYGFGCADLSTLVEFTSRNPRTAPRLVLPIYDRCAAAVISRKERGIDSFKALEGHSLGTGVADSGSRILPALLRIDHIDPTKIAMQALDVSLRDTMLLAGRVDAVVGNDYTVLFNLAGRGVKPTDMNVVYFADNGFDFYGQGLIVNQDVLAKNPDLVRRMAIAVAKIWILSAKDPEASVASACRRDTLLDNKIEVDRLKWLLDHLVLTANVRANGLGAVDMDRIRRGIAVCAEGFQMAQSPDASVIFDPRFIPSDEVRHL